MKFFSNMKLKGKLTIAAAALSIIPAVFVGSIVGWQSVNVGYDAVSKEAEGKLSAVLSAKKEQIESYLGLIKGQIITLSDDRMTIQAMKYFAKAYKSFRNDAEISDAQAEILRGKLASYYDNDFTNAYKELNSGKSPNADPVNLSV